MFCDPQTYRLEDSARVCILLSLELQPLDSLEYSRESVNGRVDNRQHRWVGPAVQHFLREDRAPCSLRVNVPPSSYVPQSLVKTPQECPGKGWQGSSLPALEEEDTMALMSFISWVFCLHDKHTYRCTQAPCVSRVSRLPPAQGRHSQDRPGTWKVLDQQVSPVDRIIP